MGDDFYVAGENRAYDGEMDVCFLCVVWCVSEG